MPAFPIKGCVRVSVRSVELDGADAHAPNVKIVVPIPTTVATFPVLVKSLFSLFKNLSIGGLSLSIS